MSNSVFSARLRAWRRGNNLKQKSLANLLGVSQSAISHWEAGRDLPCPTAHAKLLDLMSAKTTSSVLSPDISIVTRQLGLRTFGSVDGIRLLAVSRAMRQIWPESDIHIGKNLAEYAINQLADIYFNGSLMSSIRSGDVALISGVSERDFVLPECIPHLCRWTYAFKKHGSDVFAELAIEPCESTEFPGIKDILFIDDLAR